METVNLNEFTQSSLTQSEYSQSLEFIKAGDKVVRLKTRENPQFKDLIHSMEIVTVKSVSAKTGTITIDSPYANKFNVGGTQTSKKNEEVYGTNWYYLYTYRQALPVYLGLTDADERVNISEELENIFRKIC